MMDTKIKFVVSDWSLSPATGYADETAAEEYLQEWWDVRCHHEPGTATPMPSLMSLCDYVEMLLAVGANVDNLKFDNLPGLVFTSSGESKSVISTLRELLSALNSGEISEYADLSALPTFEGDAPASTSGVFSWDEKNVLVKTAGCFEIVPRKLWNAQKYRRL